MWIKNINNFLLPNVYYIFALKVTITEAELINKKNEEIDTNEIIDLNTLTLEEISKIKDKLEIALCFDKVLTRSLIPKKD